MIKILFCSEAHYLHTGYAVFYKKLLEAFHKSGKYDVAEFATYGRIGNPKASTSPWKFYANGVENNDPRYAAYNADPSNKFGAWRFEKVLLHFKPDVVVAIRDIHMDSYIMESPLAPYIHKIISPTIDSTPQQDNWLDSYRKADAIFTHTQWGYDALKTSIPNANLVGVLGCGVDFDVFRPLPKGEIRKEFGLSDDLIIFGSVMRNQRRKLFPQLISGFAEFIQNADPSVAAKSYLYLHTAHPDKEGWNLPKMIKESGVSSKILCSYICKLCNSIFASIFQSVPALCPHCQQVGAITPNVSVGYTREQLAKVYNLFDCYFQVASCEGFGMPPIEAAACGIPIASVDFGPMGEVVNNIGGLKIPPGYTQLEFDSGAVRSFCYPKDIADVMKKFISEKSENSNPNALLEKYSWDGVVSRLGAYIDGLSDLKLWDKKFELYNLPDGFPPNLDNEQFIDFLCNEVLHNPAAKYEYNTQTALRDLQVGMVVQNKKVVPVTKQLVFNHFRAKAEKKLYFEQIRLGLRPLASEDFLEFANR